MCVLKFIISLALFSWSLGQVYALPTIKESSGSFNLTTYHRYKAIQKYLNELASRYPDFAQTFNFGKSFEGRNLTAVHISTDRSAQKPVILLDAGIHAREWIAPSMALFILNQLVENNSENSEYLSKYDWVIAPLLNPDGYEYSHEVDPMWRKTRSVYFNTTCIGVDANRNFDFHWNVNVIPSPPCDESYAGPFAFSEPEARGLKKLMESYKIDLYLTLHSFGNFIIYPYGYSDIEFPPNWKLLQEIAFKTAMAIKDYAGTEYHIGSSSAVLYVAPGGSDDYAYGVAGVPLAFTIELPKGGKNGFQPEPKLMLRIFHETWLGIKTMVEMLL